MKPLQIGILLGLVCLSAGAQVTNTRRPSVRAVGDATINTAPDQAQMTFSIETRANTAADAASQNATQTTAVLTALQRLLGAGADIKTTGYSVSPVYTYPPGGQPVLTGFSAVNSIQVTIANINQVGATLDTGTQAGATRVQGIFFSLKDPEPVRLQALRQAAQRARTHADAMAGGAGLRLGNVLAIDEGSAPPRVLNFAGDTALGAAAPSTPVQPGNVSVTATVTMEIELVP